MRPISRRSRSMGIGSSPTSPASRTRLPARRLPSRRLKVACPAALPRTTSTSAGKVKTGGENIDDTNEAIALSRGGGRASTRRAPGRTRSSRVRTTRVRSSSRHRTKAGAFARTPTSPWRKPWISDPNLAEAHFARGLILWTKAKGFPHEQAIRVVQESAGARPRRRRNAPSVVDGVFARRPAGRGPERTWRERSI